LKSIVELDAGDMQIIKILEPVPGLTQEESIIFKITGEINLYSSQHIKEYIETLLKEGKNMFFIELSDVSYIDSSGLGVFLGIHSKIYKSGGGIHLCSPSTKVNYVLELTKLRGLLNVFDSLEDAFEAIQNKK
jgi:anti-sigma B factor antagonist